MIVKENNDKSLKNFEYFYIKQIANIMKEIKENNLDLEEVITEAGLTPKQANETLSLKNPRISDIFDLNDGIKKLRK